jgi:hypothetical protein
LDSLLVHKALWWQKKQKQLNFKKPQMKRLLNEIKNQQETMISDQLVQTKIASLSSDAITHLESAKHNSKIIGELLERLNDPTITEAEKKFYIKIWK